MRKYHISVAWATGNSFRPYIQLDRVFQVPSTWRLIWYWRCKMVDFFDVHSTHKWCQKLVWACFSTPNACKTCKNCFWEVLKTFGFFANFFEDLQISIFGDVFLEAPHDGHLRGTWKYTTHCFKGVQMGGKPVLWPTEQLGTGFGQFVFLNQVFWTP